LESEPKPKDSPSKFHDVSYFAAVTSHDVRLSSR